jgi:hypothetical protein
MADGHRLSEPATGWLGSPIFLDSRGASMVYFSKHLFS